MCLRVNTAKPAPTKNFSVWKGLHITDNGWLETPSRSVLVSAGELVPTTTLQIPIHHGKSIEGGVIHAYATAHRAKCMQDGNTIVVRCIVKPSEFVAWGGNSDVAVTKLRLSHKTLANALKKHGGWLRKDLDRKRAELVAEYNRNKRTLQKAKRKLAK